MNKNIILGIVAIGGLILVGVFIGNKPKNNSLVDNKVVNVSPMEIPRDIPTFPIYPGSEVTKVSDTDGEQSRDISVSLSARATKNEVYDWYREALKINDWHIKSDENIAGYQIIQGENDKDKLYTSLQVANGASEGMVTINQHLKVRK